MDDPGCEHVRHMREMLSELDALGRELDALRSAYLGREAAIEAARAAIDAGLAALEPLRSSPVACLLGADPPPVVLRREANGHWYPHRDSTGWLIKQDQWLDNNDPDGRMRFQTEYLGRVADLAAAHGRAIVLFPCPGGKNDRD